MLYIIFIGILVCWLLFRSIQFYGSKINFKAERFTHSTPLEIFWTIVPAFILVLIAIPSFALLYSIDDINNPTITLKCVGHQWYWSYEYSDYSTFENGASINYDSYIRSTEDLTLKNEEGNFIDKGGLRLLEVDQRVYLPVNNHIRIIVTSADVLHSWAVPSFGVKVDACPGRLNQASIYITSKGIFFGQCSEICGVNHGFMPIVVSSLDMEYYIKFIRDCIESSS